MISPAELEAMQDVLTQTRTQPVSIERPSETSDNAGGVTVEWVTIATNVLARISPQGMQPWEKTDRIEGRVIATSVWNIFLPAGQDVTSSDRITDALARVFNVISASERAQPIETKVQAVLLG